MSLTVSDAAQSDLTLMLNGGLSELDITRDEHDLVVRRYDGLGKSLDACWAPTRGNNRVFPQGSFMLGTVVRNVYRNDDLDIDLVAVRDISKGSITQAQLKDEVGQAVWEYARSYDSGSPLVAEDSRCWTLSWPDMHMDVLPAIPDFGQPATELLITDQDTRTWLPSNPEAFASWFQSRMRSQIAAIEDVEEKRLEIERVPYWHHRCVLQRAVQALKRHRDIYFIDRPHERPSSIVITTLAAYAYSGTRDLPSAISQILSKIDEHLLLVRGEWLLSNPAQPDENFVDSWASEPWRSERFFEWLSAAKSTFRLIESTSGLDQTIPMLESAFGRRFAQGAVRDFGSSIGDARCNGTLRTTSGGLSTAGATAPQRSRPVREHGFAGGIPPLR